MVFRAAGDRDPTAQRLTLFNREHSKSAARERRLLRNVSAAVLAPLLPIVPLAAASLTTWGRGRGLEPVRLGSRHAEAPPVLPN
jgi:hypothetical protein